MCYVYGSVIPTLPDSEYLRDFIQKVRNKLRTLDEMASSPKLFKKDAEVDKISQFIRNSIRSAMLAVEDLDESSSKQSALTDHIGELCQLYLRPLSHLITTYSSLPLPMNVAELIVACHSVEAAEDTYSRARSSHCLLNVAKLKYEAECIEAVLCQMLSPLRVIARTSRSPMPRREASSAYRVLVPLLLSPEEEFLARCGNK